MKKVVRLTESDLQRIVKKVLREQTAPPMGSEVQKAIMECFSSNTKVSDLAKIPTCVAIGTEVLTTKRLPTDMEKGMRCANEIVDVVGGDPFTAFGKLVAVGQCLIQKAGKMRPESY